MVGLSSLVDYRNHANSQRGLQNALQSPGMPSPEADLKL